MSIIILERNDNYQKVNSYVRVYKTYQLYKMKTHFRKLILRIVKKSILGTNFIYFYSKQGLFISSIFNLLLINLNFLIFPQLLYNKKTSNNPDNPDISDTIINKDSNDIVSSVRNLLKIKYNTPGTIIFRLFIINLIDIIFFSAVLIKYKYKQKIINNYMHKYTQCAIDIENEIIKKKYKCVLSNDGKFRISIYSKHKPKKTKNNMITNLYKNKCGDKYFFEYVINLPNIRFLSHYTYKKIFLPKENEIINKIIAISNEIEYKYKKKLLTFLIIILSLIIYIPLMNIFMEEKRKDFINYFGILLLLLFVERNNFFQNKNEQIQRVSLLNNEYIQNGYYIYINNDIISIFFVKEQFRNNDAIAKLQKLNERLLYEFKLI